VLLGAAGVIAARNGGSRRSKISKTLRKQALPALRKGFKGIELPKPDGSTIDWVEKNAKNVGDASYRVAELSTQARDVQKALSGKK
jgi:hypothetical protein